MDKPRPNITAPAFASLASGVLLALLSWGCTGTPTIPPAQIGKSLYEVNCAICHGATGDGDGPVGESMKPQASRLNDTVTALLSDSSIFNSIRNGVMRDGRQTMPPAKDLSDEQISQLIAYLRTLPRK